ncbi:MAG TPA: hypothetical protein VK790_14440 [Solirubrobacteraceae bacterium]|jgi:hypothetical protein|nr:hypothetical protein [Solirubrobacteraceae bacterium]
MRDAAANPPSEPHTAADLIARADLDGARAATAGKVVRTPALVSAEVSVAARARANLVTGVELTLETRGRGHTDEVLAELRAAGYEVNGE